jgi:hydrogenase maturation protein HypF
MRVRARVEGTVQGVGFRPYVHGLARELGLAGFVLNDSRGVLLEVEGEAVPRFLERLPAEAPPLALVERVRAEPIPATGEAGFAIRESTAGGRPQTAIAPDTATCEDCLAELFDPADRRYRYPFINCTNCGPRFTIVRGIPYDRPLTTMAAFAMCDACRAEYEDPEDRRYHAQPNACPACGPRTRLHPESPGDPIAAAAQALAAGAIVAVKGLGGFHLACRASHEGAVAALRARKHREDRPFALMVRDVTTARALAEVDEAALLARERPIVLGKRRPDAPVAEAVAPRSRDLGVMLPYSPLHHLLLADAGFPLVMTSGNVSDEPIAHRDGDALERLAGLADLFLLHDREIHTRVDDSVVRAGRLLRRSRGHVPSALALPRPARALLAVGAELKSTFCLAAGPRAWVGHHIGDLKNYETLSAFTAGIAHFECLLELTPELVVHDLHPEYLSTEYALEREGVATLAVQHHHAHLAACLAEHGREGPAAGALYDGTGYGADGTVWGGEILLGGLGGYERAGHLRPVRMPGGEAAIRAPWRMACAWLAEAGVATPLPGVDPERWAQVAQLARTGLASPVTTSAGRLCDAVAALCGVRLTVTYEGQAAIELEAAADVRETAAYPLAADLDARPTILAITEDLGRGVPVATISARFHNALADATAAALLAVEAPVAVLSGGVFQNELLLARTAAALEAGGVEVLIPRRLPANDGGLSYGQAAIAAAAR